MQTIASGYTHAASGLDFVDREQAKHRGREQAYQVSFVRIMGGTYSFEDRSPTTNSDRAIIDAQIGGLCTS